jgi:hypothetical protein
MSKAPRRRRKSSARLTTIGASKLPLLARNIERTTRSARRFVRRAYEMLVIVESAGPGPYSDAEGGTDDALDNVLAQELDRAIDELQEILDAQQDMLNTSLGGDSAGDGPTADKPCQIWLTKYQAALKVGQSVAAAQYWKQYTDCLATPRSPRTPVGRPLSP